MFWKKSKNIKCNSEERTKTAKAETTNTTVRTETIYNEDSGKVTFQTSRQTVMHRQQAQVSESITHRTATSEQIEKLFPEMNLTRMDFRYPTILHSNESFTQNRGSTVKSIVEEQRIKLDKSASYSSSNSFSSMLNSTPNTMVVRPYARAFSSSKKELSFPQMNQALSPSNKIVTKSSSVKSEPLVKRTMVLKPDTRTVPPPTRTLNFQQTNQPNSQKNSLGTKLIPKSVGNTSDAQSFSLAAGTQSSSKANTPTSQKNTLGTIPKSPFIRTESLVKKQQKSKLKPGFAFIFNNQYFDDPKNEERVGTDADVKALVETFKKLKLTIELHENLPFSKVKNVVKSITNKDFKNHSCLVIVILSHGNRFETVQAKDKSYSIDDDVLFPITSNRTLADKPKIFFIQACKGTMEVGDYRKDAQVIRGIPAEILKCYSTFEGYVSYRTTQGTLFIQKLCENLQRDGETQSIDMIMKSVTAAVKRHTNGKQIPTMTINLTEPFVFGDYF